MTPSATSRSGPTDRLRDAQGDLKRAQKQGKLANERAQRAGRSAAGEFGGLAGEAQEPVMVTGGAGPMGSAVVPITVPAGVAARAAGNPFGPNGGLAGNPFARPGSPGNPFSITPGVIRQRQITEAQQRAAAEAQAAKKRKEGGVGDGLSGLVNGWTFGLVDLGGNKKSDRYKRGELASLIPLTPMGLAKDAEKGIAKGGEKLLAKEAEQQAAKGAPRAGASAVEDASQASFKAAQGPIDVSRKHLAGAGGRYNKFAQGVDVDGVVREALRSPDAIFRPNPGGGYRVDTDLGRAIGQGGRSTVRSIVSPDGRVITAFPYGPKKP